MVSAIYMIELTSDMAINMLIFIKVISPAHAQFI